MIVNPVLSSLREPEGSAKLNLMRFEFNLLITLSLFTLLLSSCGKTDKPAPAPSGNYTNGVWIINEGGFTHGNASVDFYHKDKDTLERSVFENVNNHPLGDVLQSITHVNGKYFMVLNNSSDIVVADDKTFKTAGVISNLGLPRYLFPVNDKKAYLTNNTSGDIAIINLNTQNVSGHIPYAPQKDSAWAGWTEQMVIYHNEAYITAVKRGQLLVIDINSDKITDSIPLSIGAIDVVLDKENKIWVLCDGTLANPFIHSKLFRIDPATKKILSQYTFPDVNTEASLLQINAAGDTLYYVSGGICKMGILEQSLPTKSMVGGSNHSFYGLGIDPYDNTIYAGDDIGFGQPGLVFQYSANGKLMKTHKAGVGPNGFLFVK